MHSVWFDTTIAWISAHPLAAGALVFLIAFSDAVIILGAIVPALPLMIAIGVLIGMGELSGPYAVTCAALGALAGDGLSYWVGRRWGESLRGVWPFRRYPSLLERGENLFRRNAFKSILIARYVGAVRPFVPAIAGMANMPLTRYLKASGLACVSWAVLFLLPGWALGQAYDAVAAVADKLLLVLLGLITALALAWALVLYTWRWFALHADSLLARTLRWTHAHPRLRHYVGALIDRRRPETAPILLLAICLFAVAWLWTWFSVTLLARGGPLLLDHDVYALMFSLRNPLADRAMATLAAIGSAPVLGAASAAALAWLLWRRRWKAALHWVAAIAIGLGLTEALDAVIDMPRPPFAAAGFGFPSVAVTMTTVVFGFFAVLIARELPGRQRVWPYLLTGVATALVGFARLYLGAHWLSDIIGGVLLGAMWVLVIGVAYRRHSERSFWMRPLGWTFYGAFALAACWYAPRSAPHTLARFEPPPPTQTITMADWKAQGLGAGSVRFDLEIAGDLSTLKHTLLAHGWQAQPAADWVSALGLMNDSLSPAERPVLPLALDAHPERLLLRRVGKTPTQIEVLRVWPAPVRVADGTPLWVARYENMQLRRRLRLLTLWKPEPPAHALPKDLQMLDADNALQVLTHPR
ncbi:MAG TPA: bifunctional DedA family/phosphatase PAP2 family protein [Thermomonas sp.]|jgi:membrane protein DedA with SNARE-associated domain/membrane-associated phospholipid phosphatase|uniref:bifunctional DedA family/phosphatase PAP2 family protein n=1 Tax=Thermomonas sp. TaxID=1971895 RepID=UPI002CEEF21C|nr:bifunctional DedA family/phosphatase PAP2 family protein [Thermomonas sp.]HOV96912.1 bifunctional DedA family/phosphatase PAP2 family protein [Thermomonas sp.]